MYCHARAAGKLTLLLVNDAGHMVPMDLPEVALDMMHRVVAGRGFADQKQKIADEGHSALASDCSRALEVRRDDA